MGKGVMSRIFCYLTQLRLLGGMSTLIARFMGPTWVPGGSHVGPMNLAIWEMWWTFRYMTEILLKSGMGLTFHWLTEIMGRSVMSWYDPNLSPLPSDLGSSNILELLSTSSLVNATVTPTGYPVKYTLGLALFCFVSVISFWQIIYPCSSGLLHWNWYSCIIAPVPVNSPWWIIRQRH